MSEDGDTVLAEISEKTDEELRAVLERLDHEEQELSYRRRMLHAKIDILKAELTARLKEKHRGGKGLISARDLEKLSAILARDLVRDKKKPI